MLVVHLLPAVLSFVLLLLLEGKRVQCKQTRLHQKIHQVATGSSSKHRDSLTKQGPNSSFDIALLM